MRIWTLCQSITEEEVDMTEILYVYRQPDAHNLKKLENHERRGREGKR
jgi:hypothetical protein